ncbi:MAG: endonuclease [Verrucomicrobia bacterium]|nr:endonuclease [Verrucomicrobiota bacterium]
MFLRLFRFSCGLAGIVLPSASSAALFHDHPWLPPANYYASAQGLAGTQLDSSLNTIIRGHTVISYANLPLVFRVTDVDPENPNNLILLYSGQSMPASMLGAAGPSVWNREHVWPRSWGVGDNGADYSDAHHIYPCNAQVNSTRSNLNFDWTDPTDVRTIAMAPGSTFNSRSFEPRDEDKGRSARAILYMATRYDGTENNTVNLRVGNRPNQSQFTFGWLEALLAWNRMFPPDDYELRRNHQLFDGVVVDGRFFRQGNRNPFADFPELADAIYLNNTAVTFGNWRWRHFTIQQLWNAEISGDLADPDGDGIPNLIELAINGDPFVPTEVQPMTWTVGEDGGILISHPFLRQAELSGLSYSVEVSSDPWIEDSWTTLEIADAVEDIEVLTDFVAVSSISLPAGSVISGEHLRLRVDRAFPITQEGVAVWDPTLAAANGSIFAYDLLDTSGWRFADWFGWSWDKEFPWVYSVEHSWNWVVADSPLSVWQWDPVLGWYWFTRDSYPVLYRHDSSAWYWFDTTTATPERSFFSFTSASFVLESEF